MTDAFKLIRREFNLNLKNLKASFLNIYFFIISSFIFFISLSSELSKIEEISHGIIWCILFFSLIFSVDQFYDADYNDGSLKELKTLGYSSTEIILSKFFIMWLFIALPLIILSPVVLYSFTGSYPYNKILSISLFLGSPSLILLASLGEILLLKARKNKIMLLLIIAPFYVPVLIFGIGTIDLVRLGYSPNHNFYILIGFFMITLPLTLILGKLSIGKVGD